MGAVKKVISYNSQFDDSLDTSKYSMEYTIKMNAEIIDALTEEQYNNLQEHVKATVRGRHFLLKAYLKFLEESA